MAYVCCYKSVKIMEKIALTLLTLVALKAIIIGSDFSLPKWIKYGKKYIKQYNDWQRTKP